MGKIRHLSETIINKIAAGEVVERPASIVKELIENSIDAGAKNITVEITEGGKKHICVRDDGCGMSEDDIFMSLENHATSKLSSIEDLESIGTMGFRGEAVPSIAAVTKFSIASAQSHGDGFKIETKNGAILKNFPLSMPKGTEIVADDIFFNISARRKFLKEERTEYAKIREIVTNFAVCYHNISFTFKSDSKTIFTYSAAASRLERIAAVWRIPKDFIGFAEVSHSGTVSVEAFIPSPTEQVPNHSVTAVNGRIVSDRTVNAAVFSTFREAIGGEFKSPVMLFIKTEPGFVDVNVHPAKLEVRFVNTGLVTETIKEAMLQSLHSIRVRQENTGINESQISENLAETRLSHDQPEPEAVKPASNQGCAEKDGLIHGKIQLKPLQNAAFTDFSYEKNATQSATRLIIREESPEYIPVRRDENTDERIVVPENGPDHENLFSMKLRDYKKIGVVFGVYLVLEMKDKIVFLDQHAAHERITYTKLQNAVSMKNGLSQELIAPLLIKLSSSEIATLEENGGKFRESGFVIDIFDENSATLRATPALGFETDWTKVIKEMLGEFSAYGDSFEMKQFFMSHLAQKACKASVRKNDILADEEIDALIDAVNKSDFISCPHGRPFFFTLTKNEFEKKVQRR